LRCFLNVASVDDFLVSGGSSTGFVYNVVRPNQKSIARPQ